MLTTLKPAQSRVIRLVKLQGLSIEEASKATGQSATLVKVNIHRGLKRLTSLLRSESMLTDPLIERLINELKPVRRRTVWSDAIALVVLCAVELGLFLALGMMRPDMPMAMHVPSFWWKLISLGLIALVSGTVAIMSLDPVRLPRRGLRWIVALIAVCLAIGWILDASRDGFSALLSRSGLAERAAMPLQDGRAVCARCDWPWLADAAWCADRPWRHGSGSGPGGRGLGSLRLRVRLSLMTIRSIVAVWYSLGCGAVTLFARLTLPRLTRW